MNNMEFKDDVFCKGVGLNCPTCKDRNSCNQSTYEKPLELESKIVWLKQRTKAMGWCYAKDILFYGW